MSKFTLVIIGAALAVVALPPAALAQQTSAKEGDAGLQEIVVTARKREETLQDIPIAISAVSADRLERQGITRLEELTLQVSGVQFHPLGLAIPGRVNSSIRFRGMDVNSQVPTFQLGTLFIDGIYVLGGTSSIPLDDVARVEVVKGPQSAYFGRNTFGGAINYISKQPSMEGFEGDLKASGAQFDEYEVSGAFSGPIIPGKLAFRVAGRSYETGGMWTASDGGRLGEQKTTSYSLAVKATPTENLTLTARLFHARDEDGPAAGGAIPGRLNDSCAGRSITNNAGQVVTPMLWFCGNVPENGDAISVLGTRQIIDSNTRTTSARALASTGDANWLLPNLVQRALPAAIVGKVPGLDGIELKRDVDRLSLNATYAFDNGYSIDLLAGDNKLAANWVRDFNFTAFDNAYSRDPQYSEDRSYELRLTSPQEQRFRWLIGLNYYEQDFLAAGTGGDSAFLCVDTITGPTIGTCRPGPSAAAVAFFPNGLANTDRVETSAVFAAAAYDFSDRWTLNLEGRYQDDSFRRGLTTFQTIEGTKFLPRVIVQFKPGATTNLYASYAEGLLQGELNQLVIDAYAREKAQFEALGSPGQVPEEILDSFELGWKQRLLDDRIAISTAVYYGDWTAKKVRQVVAVNFTCGDFPATVGSPGCRPNLGEASAGQPSRNADGSPSFNNSNVVSAYDVEIWGAEFEATAALTERLRLGGALTYARSRMKEGIFNTVTPIAGSNNIKGNANPRFPEWSGSVNAEYEAPLTDAWRWFVRGDASYFGKTFVDLDNVATCKSYVVANSGAGVSRDKLRVELFVKNLFDDDSWAACARFLEFDLPQDGAGNPNIYQTVIVAPQLKRQLGLRASWRF